MGTLFLCLCMHVNAALTITFCCVRTKDLLYLKLGPASHSDPAPLASALKLEFHLQPETHIIIQLKVQLENENIRL